MRHWAKEEKAELWEKDQIMYAELAHNYQCCDLPTKEHCLECIIDCHLRVYEKIKGFKINEDKEKTSDAEKIKKFELIREKLCYNRYLLMHCGEYLECA